MYGNWGRLPRERHPVPPRLLEEGASRCRARPARPSLAPGPRGQRRTHPLAVASAGDAGPGSPDVGFLRLVPRWPTQHVPLLLPAASCRRGRLSPPPRSAVSRRGAPGVPPRPGDPPKAAGGVRGAGCIATPPGQLALERVIPPARHQQLPRIQTLQQRRFRFRRGSPGPPPNSPIPSPLCLTVPAGRSLPSCRLPREDPAPSGCPAAAGEGPGPPSRRACSEEAAASQGVHSAAAHGAANSLDLCDITHAVPQENGCEPCPPEPVGQPYPAPACNSASRGSCGAAGTGKESTPRAQPHV